MPVDEATEADSLRTASNPLGIDNNEERLALAAKYPIKNNPSFVTIADSFCVACIITKGGNLHAYMNRKEAQAVASHLFSMPSE